MHGRGEKHVKGFGRKAWRKRPLERRRHRWEDGIKMDLNKIGCGGVEWIHLAQDKYRWRALVNAVINLQVLASRSYYFPVHHITSPDFHEGVTYCLTHWVCLSLWHSAKITNLLAKIFSFLLQPAKLVVHLRCQLQVCEHKIVQWGQLTSRTGHTSSN
jgi:hypothetical protein